VLLKWRLWGLGIGHKIISCKTSNIKTKRHLQTELKRNKTFLPMSGSLAVTAFVQAPPSLRQTIASQAVLHVPTALNAAGANVVMKSVMNPATKVAALAFFNGVRVPATLLAGSSLVALFSLTGKANDTSGLQNREIWLLRIYHVFSLLTFCLSMCAILISTSASTMLLLAKYEVSDPNIDVYHFLRSALNFEFVFTRWSFLTATILFVVSVTGRLLLEFDLLSEKRMLPGVCVITTMGGVVTLMLSFVNQTLICWPNLFMMTKEVGWVSVHIGPSLVSITFFCRLIKSYSMSHGCLFLM
jgi:hypothetical protein